LNKFSYVFVPVQYPPASKYELMDKIFLYPVWAKDESEWIKIDSFLGRRTNIAIALCTEESAPSKKLYSLVSDFVLFQSFIIPDPIPYEWFEKIYSPRAICLKESKSKNEFIKSLDSGQPKHWLDFYLNYDEFPPILKIRKFKISYANIFKKFLKAKTEKMKIYNYIRMYEFANNLKWVNLLYPNEALSFATLYTIFDSLVGSPLWCDTTLECGSCGRTVNHTKESLAKYQNRKLADILKPLYTQELIEQWQEFVKKMNRMRSRAYHQAGFINFLEEWLAETRRRPIKQHTEERWSLNRVIKEFETSFTAKQLAFSHFKDLIRLILIINLLHL